jgi:hypothetical protein
LSLSQRAHLRFPHTNHVTMAVNSAFSLPVVRSGVL